jgi:anti-sigma B factor antagonist
MDLRIQVIPGASAGTRILRLNGPFTLEGVFEFQSIFRSGNDPITVIDLTEVPYMDSASLGSLVGVHTSSQRNHRPYALVGVSKRLQTLFEVGGVKGILVIYPSLEEAEQKLAIQSGSKAAGE